jgi:hypothetical protein
MLTIFNTSTNLKDKNMIGRLIDAVASTFATLVFYVLFNMFYKNIFFLNADFDKVIYLYNLSLIIAIALNASRIIIWGKRYKSITQLISNIIFFFLAYWIWVIFPFNTAALGGQANGDMLIRIIIVVSVIGTFIGSMTEFFKLISRED